MKRTYRSKKDTAGALDHRDVLQNLDEKSSAFDAFYIQRIKETKRELSCFGSSNQLGVASSKVRKRKYVKRIVKEAETARERDTMSPAVHLTPDKSFRVNKAYDPFDMLLNSSPACQQPVATDKEHLSDKLLPKKETRAYTRKKLSKAKRITYSSSDSWGSDKENETKCNVTDIRKHQLIIEKEPINNSPKNFDESLNNIVHNLSSLMKRRKSSNNTFNTSFKYKNKLGLISPYQKSPLCSTPFKEKYRGKSIYNFSPITSRPSNSPEFVTIRKENSSNNSPILINKSKNKLATLNVGQTSIKAVDNNEASPVIQNTFKHSSCNINNSIIIENSNQLKAENLPNIDQFVINNEQRFDKSVRPQMLINVINEVKTDSDDETSDQINIYDKTDCQIVIKATSSPEVTDSDTDKMKSNYEYPIETNVQRDPDEYLELIENSNSQLVLDGTQLCTHKNNEQMFVENSSNKSIIDESDTNNLTVQTSFQTTEDEPFLGFSGTSLTNEQNKLQCIQDKLIDLDSSGNTEIDQDTCSIETNNNSNISVVSSGDISTYSNYFNNVVMNELDNFEMKNKISSNTSNADQESMYDTCSDTSLNEVDGKEPIVAIEKLSDSLLWKYYKKKVKINIDEDEYCNKSTNSEHSESKETENQQNEIIIVDSDDKTSTDDFESEDDRYNTEDNASEEDKYISFVTTRKRNEIAPDSMFIFDNSNESSSTDCDKTVLSCKANLCKKSVGSNESTENVDANLDSSNHISKDEQNIEELDAVTIRRNNVLMQQSKANLEESCSNISTFNETVIETSSSNIEKPNEKAFLNMIKTSQILNDCETSINSTHIDAKPGIVLQPGKKWERSLSIYRRMTMMSNFNQLEEEQLQQKGRKYRQSVIATMEMQDSLHNESIVSRRSTFVAKPNRSTIRFLKDNNESRVSVNSTTYDDLKGFLNEECDDTVIELSKLSLADSEHEITILETFHDSERVTTAKDYVLRRCNQTEPILFDECYPETVLKNCHKIGEGVYGEVFLYRGRDGRARVMKIVPVAGALKINGEVQKDFHEIIAEIVIAMELSALRAPIAEINRQFDEGKDVDAIELPAVENATDVFNEVLAVRSVYGPYPSRLLDLWELYDECKGSENDNPAQLPVDQQYIVLELANAGQDLESYQFTNAQQAHALFQQIAFGLAVGEESFQFEHRDLHWGNVLIAPTEEKYASFVIRNRVFRVSRCGVAATIIDYSLSRVSLPLATEAAALYNDLATDEQLFDAVGDYQFEVYRLMRDKLGNDWKNFEPYTNILWLHYTVDKMITALRYKRVNTKIHKHYINKLKGIKDRILDYGSATLYVLTDNEV